MNYGELKTAILSDSHREDYTSFVARFVQQGESLIRSQLVGYFLELVIDDDERVSENLYTLPVRVTKMRNVHYNNVPLDQVDESSISLYRSATDVIMYCMRADRILFAGIPPISAQLNLNYFGLPAPLVTDSDTNTLLTDYPQLYIEAAQVYLFKRARNLDMSSVMSQSVSSLIRDINIKERRKLGGAQSANPYNVSFRSSY